VIFPKLTSVWCAPRITDPVLASPLAWRFQALGSVVLAGQILRDKRLEVLPEFRCTANFIMYFTPGTRVIPVVSRAKTVSKKEGLLA
jgi:hypothetical protein